MLKRWGAGLTGHSPPVQISHARAHWQCLRGRGQAPARSHVAAPALPMLAHVIGAAKHGAPSVALAGRVQWASTAPNLNAPGGGGRIHAPRRFSGVAGGGVICCGATNQPKRAKKERSKRCGPHERPRETLPQNATKKANKGDFAGFYYQKTRFFDRKFSTK